MHRLVLLVVVWLGAVASACAAAPSIESVQGLGGRLLAAGSSPSWSPNGKSIVYCHGDELQILDIENGRSRRLVSSGRTPAWSPGDGRYVAFVRGEGEAGEVCVCEAAGGPPQRLAAGKDPRWSLNGRTVYYATKNNGCFAISVGRPGPATPAVDAPGDLLSAKGIATNDGNRLVRQTGDRLQVVDRKTGKLSGQWPVVQAAEGVPVWSPDGRYLAFAGFRCASGLILGVLDVEKNLLLRVGGDQFGCPRWSPDGSRLAVVVGRKGGAEIWSIETRSLQRLYPLAPACACPTVPQAAAELIGPWHFPRGKLVPLELGRQANWHYAESQDSPGNTLAELTPGDRVLAGIRFRIGSRMIQLQGKSVPEMPPAAEGIPIHRRLVQLYILHAAHFGNVTHGVQEGEKIGEYRLRYADGDRATFPVVIGEDVRDWWSTDRNQVSRGQMVWAGSNPAVLKDHVYLRLYLSAWKNPYPEKTVASLDFVSMKTNASPFCVAVTAEEPRTIGGEGQASGTGNRPADNP